MDSEVDQTRLRPTGRQAQSEKGLDSLATAQLPRLRAICSAGGGELGIVYRAEVPYAGGFEAGMGRVSDPAAGVGYLYPSRVRRDELCIPEWRA